ncbi:MAG: UbiH/UbiF family hydroxylase [Beijerinckiaceae bacterium]|nr:UbiH/UbiF family hydroxylase [Beijerinckiaceae bacterium]
MDAQTDILVAGAGAAGLSAAMALAQSPLSVTVVGKPDIGGSARTVALFDGSIRFLESLGMWPALADRAAALRTMRIVDDTKSLFAAPPSEFHAREIGLETFGWNIENRVLVTAMTEAARANPRIRFIEDMVESYAFGPDAVTIRTAGSGEITARLVVAADGRRSPARRAARIAARIWEYPQVALTAIFAHRKPHGEVSTEFHTRQGPCTFVPLPGDGEHANRSSLVWLMSPAEAERRHKLAPEEFAREAEQASHHLLGRLTLLSARGKIPMEGLTANALTAPRLALVGEAAHVFPPIGAQGLNLGMRDCAHLAEAIADPAAETDPGTPDTLARYERLRRGDVASRTLAVDTLNRALLTNLPPLDFLRGAGLLALQNIGPLRRLAMREGVLPGTGAPRVMRQRPADAVSA